MLEVAVVVVRSARQRVALACIGKSRRITFSLLAGPCAHTVWPLVSVLTFFFPFLFSSIPPCSLSDAPVTARAADHLPDWEGRVTSLLFKVVAHRPTLERGRQAQAGIGRPCVTASSASVLFAVHLYRLCACCEGAAEARRAQKNLPGCFFLPADAGRLQSRTFKSPAPLLSWTQRKRKANCCCTPGTDAVT